MNGEEGDGDEDEEGDGDEEGEGEEAGLGLVWVRKLLTVFL